MTFKTLVENRYGLEIEGDFDENVLVHKKLPKDKSKIPVIPLSDSALKKAWQEFLKLVKKESLSPKDFGVNSEKDFRASYTGYKNVDEYFTELLKLYDMLD